MPEITMHVEESGQGQPVVLLHAFPLSSAMWSAQRGALGEGAHVVTPDLRGFGQTPHGVDPPSLDQMADDVAALLDTRGWPSVVLGGLSMGGYVAMAFLRRHGDRVAALALVDTKASADTAAGSQGRIAMAEQLQHEQTTQALLDSVYPKLLGATTFAERPDVAARVREMVRGADPLAAAWAQRAMAARPDSHDTLRGADVPALVVVGDEDVLTPVDEARAMTEALPQGELVVLSQCGHLSAVEAPDAVSDVLRTFLHRVG